MALFNPLAQPKAKTSLAAARMVQRACACAGKSGTCESCAKKKRLQRKAGAGPAAATFDASPQLTAGGAPLAAPWRNTLGALYGTGFADVRIHHDATSHAAAHEVSARAFTLGQHVHFAAGEYQPHTRDGMRLLAHELGHTLQQRGATSGGDGVEIDAADSALEREADSAADAVLAGRSARVRGGSANGVQAKLLQREPKPGGIGTPAGGSETASVDNKIDENTVVHITRTVTERPCTEERVTTATPSDKIFYWDRQANAVGLRYEICNGRVQLTTKGEINYDKVIESAKGLLTTLQNNPALGQDLGALLDNRLDEATIRSSGEITLTVDGILQASVEGGSTTGTGEQKYNVKGILKVTPKGISFAVTGGVDFSKTPLQSATTYSLEGKVATKFFAVTLRYEQIDTSRVGGPASSTSQTTGGLDVPLPDVGPIKDVTLGPTVTVDEQGNPTFGGGIKGRFGGPDKTKSVRCYKCDCPPPLPEYSCIKEVKAHTRTVVDQPERNRQVKLLFAYNSPAPANPAEFSANVSSIAGMVGEGFTVQHIRGYASPEGSLDAPKPPVAGFRGNIALSQSRADHARSSIAKEAPGATLPQAEGKGELLGDLDGSGDTANRDITPKLANLLEPLSDEQRLATLGVDAAVRDDSARRAAALADIQAFVDGRDANGLKLAQRPRWEKVFPFLRRVEVSLHQAPITHKEPVNPKPEKGCSPEDIAFARQQMPALPPQRRIPQERCGR